MKIKYNYLCIFQKLQFVLLFIQQVTIHLEILHQDISFSTIHFLCTAYSPICPFLAHFVNDKNVQCALWDEGQKLNVFVPQT